jgi:hypothetical protein
MRKKRSGRGLGACSRTWPKLQERKAIRENRRTFAHSARAALRDAYRASAQFIRSTTKSEARLSWHLCFANLRRVGHILKSKDACRSIFMATAVEEAWQRHKNQVERGHSILDFIIAERNALLKDGITSLIIEDGNENRSPTSPNCSVIWRGERKSAREVIIRCLGWWESELDIIEKKATELNAMKKRFRSTNLASPALRQI